MDPLTLTKQSLISSDDHHMELEIQDSCEEIINKIMDTTLLPFLTPLIEEPIDTLINEGSKEIGFQNLSEGGLNLQVSKGSPKKSNQCLWCSRRFIILPRRFYPRVKMQQRNPNMRDCCSLSLRRYLVD